MYMCVCFREHFNKKDYSNEKKENDGGVVSEWACKQERKRVEEKKENKK